MTDNDVTATWREYREAQRSRREARLPARTGEILALVGQGFAVARLTDYQFRINDRLDLYPTHRRYHDLRTGRRGQYSAALTVARRLAVED